MIKTIVLVTYFYMTKGIIFHQSTNTGYNRDGENPKLYGRTFQVIFQIMFNLGTLTRSSSYYLNAWMNCLSNEMESLDHN